jgi:hypothetical protein
MKQLLCVFIAGGLLGGCANIIPPSGGAKDSSAPLVENNYPEQNQTSYHGHTIEISFDEHIQLKEINEEFYASPPLITTPNISSKNKTLSIDWEGVSLKDSTTYVFHLGNSITDYNEGNVLTNYSLQFSTGETVDTLPLSGSIVDALTKSTEKGVFAALYIYNVSNSDSLLYLERPNYIAKTDENGDFHFPNLKDEQYVLFALADEDRNLKFSLAEEFVGFHPKPISPGNENITLKLFSELTAADTISALAIDSLTEYGNLIVDSLPNTHHILEVLKGKKVVKQLSASKRTLIDSLPTGSYQLRLITDDNQNGKWDTGNLLKKRLPESITYYPEEVQLRANWDLELIWKE